MPLPTDVARVAVLSDIHGVLPALEAVLAEPDVVDADLIVLTGDITAGPQPAEVIEMLRTLGDRVLWVSGNADRELVEYRRGERTEIPDPIVQVPIIHPTWSGRMLVLVQGSAESISSVDIQVPDLCWHVNRFG